MSKKSRKRYRCVMIHPNRETTMHALDWKFRFQTFAVKQFGRDKRGRFTKTKDTGIRFIKCFVEK